MTLVKMSDWTKPLAYTVLVACSLLWPPISLAAQEFETRAPRAILIDFESGTVLYEKNADERAAPASMAKLMLLEYVFNEITQGRLSLTDKFPISEYAWRYGGAPSGGSTMFAELNSEVALADLLRGIIVQSGNDASIAIAEGLSGSELAFSEKLNARAKVIGLKNSVFRNATGLDDPDQLVTVRDLAILARRIIANYPDLYEIFSETEFSWNGINQRNRNPLLRLGIGADGLKTGHTSEAGYGMVGSAVVNTQRLIVVVSGLSTARERAEEARRLLDWGFRSFRRITIFEDGEIVAEARVFGGEVRHVPMRADGMVSALVPRANQEPLRARAVYDGPIPAPVEADQQVGVIRIWQEDRLIQERPIFTAGAVKKGNLHRRALDALQELALFWL